MDAPMSLKISRVTLIELLGYVGTAVALVGGVLTVGDNASQGTATFVTLVVTVVSLGAGLLLGSPKDDGLHRMKSVLWALSVFAFLLLLFALFGESINSKSDVFLIFAITGGYAVALWLILPRTLQQFLAFNMVSAAISILVTPEPSSFLFGPPTLIGPFLVALILGAGWFFLGMRNMVRPPRTAMVLGTISFVTAPFALLTDPEPATFLMLAVSVVALIAGSMVGDRAVTGIAVAGLLIGGISFPATILDSSGGAAIGALVVGLAMLAGGLALARSEGHVTTPGQIFGSGSTAMPPAPSDGPTGGGAAPMPSEPPDEPSPPDDGGFGSG